MGGNTPWRHEKDIKPNAVDALFGIPSKIPLQGGFDSAALTLGDRFDRDVAVRAGFYLDSDKSATSGRQNVDFSNPGAIANFQDCVTLDTQDPLAQSFRPASVIVGFLSFLAGSLHRFFKTRGSIAIVLPSWPGLLISSA